jgi:hypothetical protein
MHINLLKSQYKTTLAQSRRQNIRTFGFITTTPTQQSPERDFAPQDQVRAETPKTMPLPNEGSATDLF